MASSGLPLHWSDSPKRRTFAGASMKPCMPFLHHVIKVIHEFITPLPWLGRALHVPLTATQ